MFSDFLSEYEYKSQAEALSMAKRTSARDYGKANSGNGIYEIMKNDLGGEKALLARMNSYGVPGVQFMDNKTSNFVVFPGEENALTILERNGAPLR